MLPHGDHDTGILVVYSDCKDLFGQNLYLTKTIIVNGPDDDDDKNNFDEMLQRMKLKAD